jgi:hypothetical protein
MLLSGYKHLHVYQKGEKPEIAKNELYSSYSFSILVTYLSNL